MNTSNHVNFLPHVYLTSVTIAILGILVIIPSIILFAHADSINPDVYSIDSKPYAVTYAEWTAK